MGKGYATDNCANRRMVDFDDYISKAQSPCSDVLYDDRHQLFSENNTFDMQEYLNYINTIKDIAQREVSAGRYRYMLDLGFIPICMPPVWMVDIIYSAVRPRLDSNGIEYYQLPASSFLKGNYTGGQPDIWVNKMSVYEMCKCRPELVTVKKVLEVLGLC